VFVQQPKDKEILIHVLGATIGCASRLLWSVFYTGLKQQIKNRLGYTAKS